MLNRLNVFFQWCLKIFNQLKFVFYKKVPTSDDEETEAPVYPKQRWQCARCFKNVDIKELEWRCLASCDKQFQHPFKTRDMAIRDNEQWVLSNPVEQSYPCPSKACNEILRYPYIKKCPYSLSSYIELPKSRINHTAIISLDNKIAPVRFGLRAILNAFISKNIHINSTNMDIEKLWNPKKNLQFLENAEPYLLQLYQNNTASKWLYHYYIHGLKVDKEKIETSILDKPDCTGLSHLTTSKIISTCDDVIIVFNGRHIFDSEQRDLWKKTVKSLTLTWQNTCKGQLWILLIHPQKLFDTLGLYGENLFPKNNLQRNQVINKYILDVCQLTPILKPLFPYFKQKNGLILTDNEDFIGLETLIQYYLQLEEKNEGSIV